MRKNNKRKGFTIVELVIVIAVIGILATVMIPTISGVIADAKEAAAQADAKAIYTQYVTTKAQANEDASENLVIKVDNTHYYVVEDGQLNVNTVYTSYNVDADSTTDGMQYGEKDAMTAFKTGSTGAAMGTNENVAVVTLPKSN